MEQGSGLQLSRRQLLTGAAAMAAMSMLPGHGGRHEVMGVADPGLDLSNPADGPYAPAVRGERYQINPLEPEPRLFVPGELIRDFSTDEKVLVLTFDDGPWKFNTRAIMDILKERGYEGLATFFMPTINLAYYEDIGKEVRDRGYTIGNHSKTHSYTDKSIASELAAAQEDFMRILGIEPEYMRAPGLAWGPNIQQMLIELGMCAFSTDVILHDSDMPRISSERIANIFDYTLNPGTIALLHDGGSHINTVNAMHAIIDAFERQGYRLITMHQALQMRALGGILPRLQVVRTESVIDLSNNADGEFDFEAEYALAEAA